MAVGTLLVALAAGIAMAQVEPNGGTGTPPGAIDCANDGKTRCEGTGQPDIIIGSSGCDIIIAKEGGDIVNASQRGRDDVFGNKDDDTLDVQDEEGNDFVDCGEGGEDQAFGGRGDKFTNYGSNVSRGGTA
jgi:hypothetical protein